MLPVPTAHLRTDGATLGRCVDARPRRLEAAMIPRRAS